VPGDPCSVVAHPVRGSSKAIPPRKGIGSAQNSLDSSGDSLLVRQRPRVRGRLYHDYSQLRSDLSGSLLGPLGISPVDLRRAASTTRGKESNENGRGLRLKTPAGELGFRPVDLREV
jgi:hypothetical protein